MRSRTELDGPGEDLVSAAIKLLSEEGAAAMTVRRVADAAGLSTMAVYSRFGDMATLLDAVYVRGFALLAEQMAEGEQRPGVGELERLGLAYRRFALANPALFALMFERPLPGFDPSPSSRTAVLDATFGILQAAVVAAQEDGALGGGDPRRLGFLIWVGVHGTVALEATYTARSALDDWFLHTDDDGVDAVRAIVRTTCAGLRQAG